uniref:G protein-coupled receptor n=1 Tax=Panagrellus redivivus TaxID=6233 RepID=A0A7E4VUA9_PANRE
MAENPSTEYDYPSESISEDPQSLSFIDPRNASITQIMYTYPPTEEPTLRRLLITMYLIACLTIGICGNFSQLTLQYYAYRIRSSNTSGMKTYAQIYICMLHIVYFSISISLPSVIIEQLIQIWMFGILTCASHLFLVTIGRTAAAWLTVMLFLDQLVIALLYFVGNSLQWFAIGSYHFGNLSEEQSVTLADLAILFQYTLPAVVWVPLSLLSSTLSTSGTENSRIIRRSPGAETIVTVPRSHRWSAGELSLFPLVRHSQTTATAISMSNSLLSNAESEVHNFLSVPRHVSAKNTNNVE